MQVEVAGDSGAGGAAQIHAEVVTFGMINRLERRLHALCKLHDFGRRFGIEPPEIRGMRVRHDHHVARCIWVAIQNDVIFDAAQNDKRFRVLVRRRGVTENAADGFSRFGNVAVTPGRPDVIHKGRGSHVLLTTGAGSTWSPQEKRRWLYFYAERFN